MNTELSERIHRIYSSVKAIEETEPNKLKAAVINTDKYVHVFHDFGAGLGNAELSNYLYSLIHNIANFRNHLKRWFSETGKDKDKVDEVFNKTLELRIIQDLSDNDKHGYPPRNGGCSQISPQLVNINRVMQLKTQAKKGSTIGMTLGAGGVPQFFGDGTFKAIITGDVLDNKNNQIGDLYEIASKAVQT